MTYWLDKHSQAGLILITDYENTIYIIFYWHNNVTACWFWLVEETKLPALAITLEILRSQREIKF